MAYSKDMTLLLTLVVSALCATMVSCSSEFESSNNLQSLVDVDELHEARLFTSALTTTGTGGSQVTFTGWEWALLFGSIILLTALFSALLSADLGSGGGNSGPAQYAAPTGYAQ
ncbi:unnamed protein product, partial [Meganyctiphanes norvegica]